MAGPGCPRGGVVRDLCDGGRRGHAASRDHPRGGRQQSIPSWSRDGHWIYFTSNRSGRDEIWKLAVAGGKPVAGAQAVQVTRSGGSAPQVSVDGQYLYYVKQGQDTRLFRMPVEGGEEQQVVPGADQQLGGIRRDGEGRVLPDRPDPQVP